jgi:hypothetical protein
MNLVTQKTVDWLTMTDSGTLIGFAQGKLPRLLRPVRWLLITVARAFLVLSMCLDSPSWIFSDDQGFTWIESNRLFRLPKDVRHEVWKGIAKWAN